MVVTLVFGAVSLLPLALRLSWPAGMAAVAGENDLGIGMNFKIVDCSVLEREIRRETFHIEKLLTRASRLLSHHVPSATSASLELPACPHTVNH